MGDAVDVETYNTILPYHNSPGSGCLGSWACYLVLSSPSNKHADYGMLGHIRST